MTERKRRTVMFDLPRRTSGFESRSQSGPLRAERLSAGPSPGLRDARHPLFLLLLAALIPVLTLGGWAAYNAAEHRRDAARRAARDVVERVAERIKGEMTAQVQVAEVLALSTSLDEPDLATFYQEARRLKERRPLWHTVELDNLKGEQLLNLLRPLGNPLGPTADRASFELAVREKRSVVGSIGPVGLISGIRLLSLRAPVRRSGMLRFVLTVSFAPEAIGTILREAGVPDGWIGLVVDGHGHVIARSVAEQMTLGQPAGASVRDAVTRSNEGFYRDRTLEGIDVETVFRALPEVDHWSVHLGVPSEALDGPVRRGLVAIGGGLAASLALAGGLVVMVSRDLGRQRQDQQRRAAVALEDSEARAALAIDAAEFGPWVWNLDEDTVFLSSRCRRWLDLTGADTTRPAADLLLAVHPDDRDRLRTAVIGYRAGHRAIDVEFRVREVSLPSQTRWLRVRGRAASADGTASRGAFVYGIMADIGPQKRAEAERQDLLRRLAEAQERTQARIARELHDQVGQAVTGLSLGLKRLEQAVVPGAPGADVSAEMALAVPEQLTWLRRVADEIGRDLHRAAADLRPTALDDLGLMRALVAHAAEWSRHHGVAVDVQGTGFDEGRLPAPVETAAYRMVQEALTNVIKHAKARQVSVVLERRARELRVLVEDDGVGFDAEARSPDDECGIPHLGISGMRERLALVGGEFAIESAPGSGTTLFARMPLGPKAVTT